MAIFKNTHCCNKMDKFINEKKINLNYDPRLREYGIYVLDGSALTSSIIQSIHYCPWCGHKLPESLRVEWFEALEQLGFENPWDQDIPHEFKSDAWWRKKYNL